MKISRRSVYLLKLSSENLDNHPVLARLQAVHGIPQCYDSHKRRWHFKCYGDDVFVSRKEIIKRVGLDVHLTRKQAAILNVTNIPGGAKWKSIKAAYVMAGGSGDNMAILCCLGRLLNRYCGDVSHMQRKPAEPLGYMTRQRVDGRWVYSITNAGREALKEYQELHK